ncbi:ATP phosphoribosyltransferase [Miniphocaeibacter massiliensis]|uniref:ATP phosphoribosyltransferase n=1 Tax=Miniphocaeibacter massiliensis TaxID=2041841 RepID=UPI000C07D444|nr:ATP phosphoribosyltransferase [Miniphocaeibacter massiliensis]
MEKYFLKGSEYLFEDKIKRIDSIGNTILDCAKREGFKQISTPYFENYELYKNYDKLDRLNMTKVIDKDGKIIVLRPDATIPIAKIVSSKFEVTEVVKLCYLTTIFREYKSHKNYGRDFLQGGVELFGADTSEVDYEIINLSTKMLGKIGFSNIQIDIGNIAYQEGYFKSLNIEEDKKSKIKELIETKNISDINEYLNTLNIGKEDKEFLNILPKLFGDFDSIINIAKKYAKNNEMKYALLRMEEIHKFIIEKNTNIKVKLDLSFTNSLNYYTDLIFKVYAGSLHVPVVSGGRCNKLSGDFGANRPCCGFGINVNLVDEYLQDGDYDEVIHIALAKGRVHKQAMKRFEECGLVFPEYSEKSRKLLFLDSSKKIEIILVKSQDVPIYVENGAADIGIVGNDVLLEDDYKVYELMNLNIGICRMATAIIKGSKIDYNKKVLVASKYPNITSRYFNNKGVTINLIKLNGSVELGPIVKLSDLIVDIVETGSTLKENNLVEDEKILDISSRLICNKVALKTKSKQVENIMEILKTLELK